MTNDDLRIRWTLRDTGGPGYEDKYTETGTPEALAEYVDVPVRDGLHDLANKDCLDSLVTACREGELERAQQFGKPFGIYVSEATND